MPHKDPVKKKAYHQEYHKKNKNTTPEYRAKVAAKARQKREADPLKYRVHVHQFGVRKRAMEAYKLSTITNESLYNWLAEHNGKPCPYCGKESSHIDHIIPLAKGGEHSFENLQSICAICNYAKRDLTEREFLEHIKLIASNIA